MKFSSPPYPALPLHLAYVCHGRHSVPFAQGGRSAFQGLCEVPFRLGYVVLLGNTSVSNFSPLSLFRIRKSIGRGYSSRSCQVFGSPFSSHLPPSTFLVSSRCSVTATPMPSFPTPSSGTLLLPPRGRSSVAIYKNPPWLRPPSWPSRMPLSHSLHTPSYPAIWHCFVPRHCSGVQVHTLTS